MKHDPIVEEIRETRKRIWKECGEDSTALIERLKKTEEKHRDRIVTLPAKKS